LTQGVPSDEFNSDKAELYETLAHPTRILILQTLSDHSIGFSELKRVTNIESSGNLSFHLNKLGSLVKADSEGNYGLTDEGREAIRVVEATERVSQERRSGQGHAGQSHTLRNIGIAIVIVLLATAAVTVAVWRLSIPGSGTTSNTVITRTETLGNTVITTTITISINPVVPVNVVNGSVTVDYADCTPYSPGALNSPPSGTLNSNGTTTVKRTLTLTENTTVTDTINGTTSTWTEPMTTTTTINGTKYWYVTIVPGSSMSYLSWYLFHGVNFSFDQFAGSVLGNPSTKGDQWTIANATVLTGRTDGGVSCLYLLPSIGIRFSDGHSEGYNSATIIVNTNAATGTITFAEPPGNPQFTQHLDPQAGIGYNADNGEITLYVSDS
jgi:DNA-binding transcriptional ArsR family regulator